MTDEALVALVVQLFNHLGDRVADQVVKRLRAHDQNMVTQAESPLGSRRHCAAVQRRVAAGLPGASIVGRKHFLTHEALQEELSRLRPRNGSAAVDAAPNIADELSTAIAQAKPSGNLSAIDKLKGSRRHHPSSSNTSTRNGTP